MAIDTTLHSILIRALGIEGATKENQEKTIESVGTVIYQSVLMRALDGMNDEEVDEFEKFAKENPAPDQMFAYLRSKVPNFDGLMEEEAVAFVAEGSNLMSQIGK
jgi:hypothetical protein